MLFKSRFGQLVLLYCLIMFCSLTGFSTVQLAFAGRCGICSMPASQNCSKCKTVHYCGRDHQKQDWPSHKSICNELLTYQDCIDSKTVRIDQSVLSGAGKGLFANKNFNKNETVALYFGKLKKERSCIRDFSDLFLSNDGRDPALGEHGS